jgi:hypothetical protein
VEKSPGCGRLPVGLRRGDLAGGTPGAQDSWIRGDDAAACAVARTVNAEEPPFAGTSIVTG